MGGQGVRLGFVQTAAVAAIVCGACFLGASADVRLQFPGTGAAVIFPSYAILAAALWRMPPRTWWILLLAASAGNYLPHRHAGAAVSFVLATEGANHLRALIAAIGLRRFARHPSSFDTLREMVAYLVFAVGLGPCAGALVSAAIVQWHGSPFSFWLAWQEWALSNVLTALSCLPLLMIDPATLRGNAEAPIRRRRAVEATFLVCGLVAVGTAVFFSSYATSSVYEARLYWPLPFLLWTAVRFGPRWTSLALLGVSAVSIWGALEQRGPFASQSPVDNLLELQVFLLAAAVPLLLLSSLLRQQQVTAAALEQAEGDRRQLAAHKSVEEALREADRRKDEFIAMLGHELRNPLASIAVCLEIIRRVPSRDSEANWANEAIGRQLQHLTRLVDDLLDISRITLGKIRLNTASIDLVRVVVNAIDVTRPLIDSLGHHLVVDVPDVPIRMRGDGVRLTQVVANLLNNAAKYTEPGGDIHVSLRHEIGGACLTVRDNGMGIAPDELGKIFDLFTQLPRRREPVAGGLGVGLSLVKRLVEMHGGTVSASSPGDGGGSEFVIHMPVTENVSSSGGIRVHVPQAGLNPRAGRRVLIADDNTDAAEGLRFILERQSHSVEVVHDGAQALDAVARRDPDVVLLDIGLPVLDGLEVARRVRERCGARRPLLVAVTGLGQPDDFRRSARAGFDHHLVKPIDLPLLEQLLASAVTTG
jgi:signal transduction histidine kinase